MIQVSGFYPSPTGVVFDSPELIIEFHGMPMGKIGIDIVAQKTIVVENPEPEQAPSFTKRLGNLPGFIIDRADLVYNNLISDPYDSLLYAIQNRILTVLSQNNPYNAGFKIV